MSDCLSITYTEDSTIINYLKEMEKRIMASQEELQVQIEGLITKVTKIGTETQFLLTKIDELLAQIIALGDISPELQAAVDALSAQVTVVDELVPDA